LTSRTKKTEKLEIEISEDVRKAGFTYIFAYGTSMTIEHERAGTIMSEFSEEAWLKTIGKLETRLDKSHSSIISKSEKIILIHFLNMWYKKRMTSKDFEQGMNRSSYEDHDDEAKSRREVIEELKQMRETYARTSFDDWEAKRREKYEYLRGIVKTNLPALWEPLHMVLAVRNILYIKEITLPFALIILGPPSTLKTLSMELLKGYPNTFFTNKFNPRSIVTHSSTGTEEDLNDIDLLPKWKNKTVLLPELAPMFTKKEDDLREDLGTLTSILDGYGYESDSGSRGHRGYSGEYMFVLAGASVEIPPRVHKVLGTIGPKLYFLRVDRGEMSEEEMMEYMSGTSYEQRKKMIKSALYDFLKWCEIRPDLISNNDENGGSNTDKIFIAGKMSINPTADDQQAITYITRLAKLLASLRGTVMTWEKDGSLNPEFDHGTITVENSSRATTCLRNLAYGLAVLEGRNHIEVEDIIHVVKIVMSTTSIERSRIFTALINNEGKLSTRNVQDVLSITGHPARRAMTELDALELVKKEEDADGDLYIRLRRKFKWFLSPEFKKMSFGFLPDIDDKTYHDFMTELYYKKREEAVENDPID